ncbi:hypothetical protein P4S95_24055 [Aneurinibacillus aneurinilyticus]|nr:hypothetical protein [Aneurinibacillus aneurinilyticus]
MKSIRSISLRSKMEEKENRSILFFYSQIFFIPVTIENVTDMRAKAGSILYMQPDYTFLHKAEQIQPQGAEGTVMSRWRTGIVRE